MSVHDHRTISQGAGCQEPQAIECQTTSCPGGDNAGERVTGQRDAAAAGALAPNAGTPAPHNSTGWREMLGAPKDGSRVLIYVRGQIDGEPVQIARWAPLDHGEAPCWVTDQGEGFYEASGWQPLPEAPAHV